MSDEQTPRSFGRYEVIGRIGAGGMGVVWRARDPRLGREVAVKAVTPRLKAAGPIVERFRREALALAKLSHPNIVRVFDAGEEQGTLYYVMELLHGTGLDRRTPHPEDSVPGQPPVFDPKEFLDLFTPLADALATVHKHGLIHRDIKPANIFIDVPERGPVLTDFGLIWMDAQAGLTLDGMVVGTGLYMAPEQARGEAADPAADVYGLGACMWEYATARVPFYDLPRSALLAARTVAELAPVSRAAPLVPGAIAAVIDRAVKLHPAERISSARELHRALVKSRRELYPKEPGTGPMYALESGASVPRTAVARGGRNWMAWTMALALATLLGVGGWRSGKGLLERVLGGSPGGMQVSVATTPARNLSAVRPPVTTAPLDTAASLPPAAEVKTVLSQEGEGKRRVALASRGTTLLLIWVKADGTLAARHSPDRGRSWPKPPIDSRLKASPDSEIALLGREDGFQLLFQTVDGKGLASNVASWIPSDLSTCETPVRLGDADGLGGGLVLAQSAHPARSEPILAVVQRAQGGAPVVSWRIPPAGPWSEPTSPAWAGSHGRFSAAVASGGAAVLAWDQEKYSPDTRDVFLSRTTGPGRAWSTPKSLVVKSAGYDRIAPTLAFVGGRLYLTWCEHQLPAYPLLLGMSTDLGESWVRARQPLWPFIKHPRTSLVGEGSRLWAAWTVTTTDEVVYSTSRDQGQSWIKPRAAGPVGQSPAAPSLALLTGGTAWLAFCDVGSRIVVMRLP